MADANRRKFLQVTGGLLTLSGFRALGANDRVNVAVVGIGGRGKDHVAEYSKLPNCRVAAVCDADQSHLERAVAQVEKLGGGKPKGYSDMRQLFADKDIDAVSLTVPNHWHALATIWACQAGKDVYVEKPASHDLYEGRKMVEAARKYGRMVQVGSQSRSIAHKREAMDLLHNGVIGKVYLAKGICYKRRPSIGHKPDGPVPAGVDWDKFRGPAPMRAFNENHFHYNWHWFWDTGNGDIGNQGVHEMDIARWGLNKGLPTKVVSTGGKFIYDDDQETPNTQTATFDYGDSQLVFEVRGLLTPTDAGLERIGPNYIGNVFLGSEGYMVIDSKGYKIYKGEKHELAKEEKQKEASQWDTGQHMQNFVNAIRSRKHTDLHADIEIGRTSAALCHLANISYRLGQRELAFDPATERFKDEAANRLGHPEYRAPYTIPDKV